MNDSSKENCIPRDIQSWLNANIPGGNNKLKFIKEIEEAFEAKKEKDEKAAENRMQKLFGEILSEADIVPFTKFIERFKKSLEGKGIFLGEECYSEGENRYTIKFRLKEFGLSDLSFEIKQQPYGDYTYLYNLNLPENMTIDNKCRLYEQFKEIVKFCQTTN